MYVTTGNISSLIKWFHKEKTTFEPSPKILCLLVAGHLNDLKFFNDIFSNRAALDVISGRDVAIFLFTKSIEEVVTIPPYAENQAFHFLPAIELIGQNFHPQKISEVPSEMRDEIVTYSQHVTHHIIEYFGMTLKDIPCILLLFKGNDDPFIIPTKGEVDVKTFYRFLIDLNKLIESKPQVGMMDRLVSELRANLPLESARTYYQKEAEDFNDKVQLIQRELEGSLNNLTNKLTQHDISKGEISKILNATYAENIPGIFRGNIHIQGLSKELVTKLHQIYDKDPETRNNCKNIRRLGRSLKCVKGRKDNLNGKLLKFLKAENRTVYTEKKDTPERIQEILSEYISIQFLLEDLCYKYERKFLRKAVIRPLRECIATFLGITKNTKDIISLKNTIEKIM